MSVELFVQRLEALLGRRQGVAQFLRPTGGLRKGLLGLRVDRLRLLDPLRRLREPLAGRRELLFDEASGARVGLGLARALRELLGELAHLVVKAGELGLGSRLGAALLAEFLAEPLQLDGAVRPPAAR